jgi:hypothetical protein
MVKVKMTSAELSLLTSHGDRGNLTFCNAANSLYCHLEPVFILEH